MPALVVTGGGGALGSAVAAAFSGLAGWEVHAPGRVELDVTDPAAVAAFFTGLRVDLLVCAAGTGAEGLLARLGPADWELAQEVNFLGAARCTRAVLPGMAQRGGGHVVFIGSGAALHPPAGLAAYATAKAALLGLTRDLARRHGPENIRVNSILPGFMDTRMTRRVSPARRESVLAAHALGALNTPDRAAAFIRFLHLEMPHTSGQVFQLDSRC